MKRKFTKIMAAFALLCVFGLQPIKVWADSVTILPSDGTPATSSDYTITKSPIVVSVTQSTLTNDQIRVFKNQTLTVSSTSATITGIEFTCTAEDDNKYGPGCFASIQGYSYSGYIGTWTGSSASVTFTASSNQVRITQIVVTYTSGGGSNTPSISANDVEIPYSATSGAITYSIANGSGNVSAVVTSGNWLTLGTITSTEVPFTCSANQGIANRSATITLSYTDAADKVVTVTQHAYSASAGGYEWVATPLANLTASDVFVIVGNNGNTYAMSNNNGTSSAPSAVSVTIANNKITSTVSANIQWNISGDANDGYTFYPNGDDEHWLYCNSDNNGVRIGTGGDKSFTYVDGGEGQDYYLYNTGKSRYIGIYNSSDWRSYTSINNNIKDQSFSFYKRVALSASYSTSIQPYSGNGGYYLIASPVEGVAPTAANGFLTNDYDLYRFDQSGDGQGNEWLNYEVTPFYLLSGHGYLYANSGNNGNATTLTFTGVPYSGNGQVALTYDANADLAGWNLIGNPYANSAILEDANNGNKAFYTLNAASNEHAAGSELVAGTPGNTIAAMQGVFVEAANNGEVVTFVEQQPSSAPVNSNYISLNVSRNRGGVIDRALIGFGEGPMLHKFQLNPNNTKIYITEGNQDYAIVRSANEAEVPVSFRAAENGTYTISVNAENIEMTYLHLIDNLTGADIDLLTNPSYTFEAKTTDYTSRFRLVFNANNVNEQNAETFAFFNGSEWVVSNTGEATLQVVDVMGRVLSTETVNGNATISLNQVPGVYMLRLVNGEKAMVQKIVVR